MTRDPDTDRDRRDRLLSTAFDRAGSGLALLPIFLGYVVATVVGVAAALTFFAHPTGDDFCNVVKVAEHGVFGAVWNEYMEWGGRWGGHLLSVGFPALFDMDYWYPLPLLIVLLVEVVSIRFLLTSVLPLEDNPRLAWSLSLLLFALHWVGMPHPGQTVYFLEGAWIYSLNISLSLVLIGCLTRLPREPSPRRLAAQLGLAALALWVAAFHELFGLVLLGVLAAGAAAAWRWRDPRLSAWVLAGGAALIGLATVLLAPGNETRQQTYEQGGSTVRAVLAVFWMWFRILDTPSRLDPVGSYAPLGWIVDARLLAATVLFASAPGVGRLRPAWVARDPLFWKLVAPVFGLLLLTGSFAGGGWALGRTLPFRAFNSLYLLFLIGWFLTVFAYTRTDDTARWNQHPSTALLRTLSLGVLALGLIFGTNFKHAIRDLGRGWLSSYHHEMQHRAQEAGRLRVAGVHHMLVDPIRPWPSSFFQNDVGDISDRLRHCVATYYGLDSIQVAGDEAGLDD